MTLNALIDQAGALAKAVRTIQRAVPWSCFHADGFAQGGVTMRDRLKNRAGFDRVLMAVAASFLTVSATSALTTSALDQADAARNSPAELAIDAAIPRPEPANIPPPTASDFKMDTTASVPDAPKTDASKTEAPKTDAAKTDSAKTDAAKIDAPKA